MHPKQGPTFQQFYNDAVIPTAYIKSGRLLPLTADGAEADFFHIFRTSELPKNCEVKRSDRRSTVPFGSAPKNYDPYRLLFVGGGLYVVGRVPKHAGTATLAIERLLSVVISKTEFDADPTIDPQKCRQDAFGVSWQEPVDVFCASGRTRHRMCVSVYGTLVKHWPIFPRAASN